MALHLHKCICICLVSMWFVDSFYVGLFLALLCYSCKSSKRQYYVFRMLMWRLWWLKIMLMDVISLLICHVPCCWIDRNVSLPHRQLITCWTDSTCYWCCSIETWACSLFPSTTTIQAASDLHIRHTNRHTNHPSITQIINAWRSTSPSNW